MNFDLQTKDLDTYFATNFDPLVSLLKTSVLPGSAPIPSFSRHGAPVTMVRRPRRRRRADPGRDGGRSCMMRQAEEEVQAIAEPAEVRDCLDAGAGAVCSSRGAM